MPRPRLIAVALALGASSCSLILSGNDEPDGGPPVDIPDNCDVDPEELTIYEGQGATSLGNMQWDLRHRLIELVGDSVPNQGDGSLVVFASNQGSPLVVHRGQANGEVAVLEVSFPIDPMRPVDGDEEIASAELFALTPDGPCVRRSVELVYLRELLGGAGNVIDADELAERYSLVDFPNTSFSGMAPIEIRSESLITIRGAVLGNDPGAIQITMPGPGGGPGGGTGQDGEFENAGGKYPGGGGGHGTPGGDGAEVGTGGMVVGHPTLLRLTNNERRGGHGGAGGDSAAGGGGGAALFMRARGLLRLLNTPSLNVNGRSGVPDAGGGSGGTIYLGAPRVEKDQSMFRVDASGGAPNGGEGRIRLDVPDEDVVTLTAPTTPTWVGAQPLEPEELFAEESELELTLLGGKLYGDGSVGQGAIRIIQKTRHDEDVILREQNPTPEQFITVELQPGKNTICIESYRHDTSGGADGTLPIPEDDMIGEHCVEIAYVPSGDD